MADPQSKVMNVSDVSAVVVGAGCRGRREGFTDRRSANP